MLGKQYKKLLSTLSSSDKALLKNVEGLAPETIEDGYVDVAIEVNPEIFLDLGLSDIGTKDDNEYIENDLGIFYAGENSNDKCWFWAFTQIDEDKAEAGDFSEEDIAGFGDGESGVIPADKETEQFKRFKEIIKPFVIQSIKDEYCTNVKKGVQENMNTDKKKSSNSLKENKKSNNKQVKESCKLGERNLTRAERHNRDMNRIFDGVKKQNDDMANFLRTKGISDEEIEEMKKNCGLHGNALRSKIAELGLDDEYFNRNKKESCKECGDNKPIKETWDGENVIDDLVDRAKSYMDEGSDIDDAINGAIDTGLIYTKDIRDLAIHYDTLPSDSELIEGFIEQLWDDMYQELGDYEPEGAESEDGDLEEESLQEGKKQLKESDINYNQILKDAYLALDRAGIRFNVEKSVFEFYTSPDAKEAEKILCDIFGEDNVYNRGFDVVVDLDSILYNDEDDEIEEESLKENKKKEPVKKSIKESLPTRKSSKKKPVKESVEDNSEVNKIAKFLKGCLEQGYNFEGLSWYDLDGDFSVSVGWLPGYDPEDANRDGSIVDENGYGLCYEITECPNTYAYADFESLLMPYNDETGDVYSVGSNFKKDDNCEEIAKYLLDEYEYIKQEFDNGELTID